MKLLVVGGSAHGKSSLIKAILSVRDIELTELSTIQDTREFVNNTIEELREESIADFDKLFNQKEELPSPNKTKKKGKKLRDWEITRFYQK